MTLGQCPYCGTMFVDLEHHLVRCPVRYKDALGTIAGSTLSPLEERIAGLLKDGPLTRDQMVSKLSVPRTTVYDGLKKLMMRNAVTGFALYDNVEDRGRGRPKVAFTLVGEDD